MGGEVELIKCRESLEHQSNISDLLLDALDLDQLSFDKFDLEKYLDFLLKSVGEKFGVPLIILRTEDKLNRKKLNVLACYGFEKKKVDELTNVTKQSSMAKELATTKTCVYIKDLEDKQATMGIYDQEFFVKEMGLKALFSCPIIVGRDFVGFIVFFKKQKDDFSNAQQKLLGPKLIVIIQRVLAFAELMDRAKNRYGFLLETYNPKRFSLLEFKLKDHLHDLIKDVGEKFKLPFIILRYAEDARFPNRFCVMAIHGFEEEQVPEIVTIDNLMAQDLKKKAFNSKKERFIHRPDIQNDKVRYDKKEFAKTYKLNSVLASPIVVEDEFKGFIVYLSEKVEGFDNKVVREFFAIEINSIIEKIFVFAESFNRINLLYTNLKRILDYEKEGDEYKSGDDRAYNCHYAAKNYLAEDMFDKAGHNFCKAAENMSQLTAPDHDFIIKNYTESSMAYARGGSEKNSRKSHKDLKDYIYNNKRIEKAIENDEKVLPYDFYYNKLIKVLDAKGFDKFAGEVYFDKMHQRLKQFKKEGQWLRWGQYGFWELISNYGESAGKFIGCTLLFILAFALCYFPWPFDSCPPWGHFCVQLEDNGKSFIYDFDGPQNFWTICQNIAKNIITSFTLSSAVFSTLGFSNITPANWWAHVIVTIEVFFGYAFLGTFVTSIGRKFLRKTY